MSGTYPCSICDFVFGNPRELGTHILTAHCNDNVGKNSNTYEEVDSKSNIKLLATSSSIAATTSTILIPQNKGKQEITTTGFFMMKFMGVS